MKDIKEQMCCMTQLKPIILLFSSRENSTVFNFLCEQMPVTLQFFTRSHFAPEAIVG